MQARIFAYCRGVLPIAGKGQCPGEQADLASYAYLRLWRQLYLDTSDDHEEHDRAHVRAGGTRGADRA